MATSEQSTSLKGNEGRVALQKRSILGRAQLSILICLFALTLAGAAVRFVALDCGLPVTADADRIIVGQGQAFDMLGRGEQPTRPPSALYPHALGRILGALPGEYAPHAPAGASLEDHLAAASSPDLTARRLIAFLSLFLIPATYLLARRFLAQRPSLLAAGLIAFSILSVSYSRQARPHGALALCMTMSLIASMWYARRGTFASLVTASAAAALALSMLHSGAAILPALAVALLLRWRKDGLRTYPRLLVPIIFVASFTWMFYPFMFDPKPGPGRGFPDQILNGAGFQVIARGMAGSEPVIACLALIGIVLGLARLPRTWKASTWELRSDLLVVGAFVIPYLTVVGMFFRSWPRFMLPVIPVFACLAAAAVAWVAQPIARRIRSEGTRNRLAISLGAVVLILPGCAAARYTWLHSQQTPREAAAKWVTEHLDPNKDTLVYMESFALPLLEDPKTLRSYPKHILSLLQHYQLANDDDNWLEGHAIWKVQHLYTQPLPAPGVAEQVSELHDCYVVLQSKSKRAVPIKKLLLDTGGKLVFSEHRRYGFLFKWGLERGSRLLDNNLFSYALFRTGTGASTEIYHLP